MIEAHHDVHQEGVNPQIQKGKFVIVDQLELYRPYKLVVTGHEPWLEEIYATFLPAKRALGGVINADIELIRQDLVVSVRGQVHFSPRVPCSRCSEPLEWPIQKKLDLYFSFQAQELPRECDLNAAQLDEYVVVDGRIDLDLILNELVQLALPSSVKCKACAGLEGGVEEPVYSSGDIDLDTHRPFADLGKIIVSK